MIHLTRVGETGSEDYRYTGKHEDPSGLYYFGARYYDPMTGRFTTRDTVFGDMSDPQSQNRYVYCLNNPHKYTDPTGHAVHQAGVEFGLGVYSIVGASFGAEIGYAWSDNEYTEEDQGLYIEISAGVGVGFGVSLVGGSHTYSATATSVEELEGSGYETSFEISTPIVGRESSFDWERKGIEWGDIEGMSNAPSGPEAEAQITYKVVATETIVITIEDKSRTIQSWNWVQYNVEV